MGSLSYFVWKQSNQMEFIRHKTVFIFDAFGTLFRTVNFAEDLTQLVDNNADSLVQLWRQKQLEYTWLYNQMQQYEPFNVITKKALLHSMRVHNITNPKVLDLLLPIYDNPMLIDGAKEALTFLKGERKKIAILSNGTLEMLQNGVRSTEIETLVTQLISVNSIQNYKPNPKVYQYALEQLKTTTEQSLFFSSNQWDVAGASTFGLDAIWVNQYGQVQEPLPYRKVWEIGGLRELVQ